MIFKRSCDFILKGLNLLEIYGVIVDITAGLKIVALPKLRLAYYTHYIACISRVFFLEILVIAI